MAEFRLGNGQLRSSSKETYDIYRTRLGYYGTESSFYPVNVINRTFQNEKPYIDLELPGEYPIGPRISEADKIKNIAEPEGWGCEIIPNDRNDHLIVRLQTGDMAAVAAKLASCKVIGPELASFVAEQESVQDGLKQSIRSHITLLDSLPDLLMSVNKMAAKNNVEEYFATHADDIAKAFKGEPVDEETARAAAAFSIVMRREELSHLPAPDLKRDQEALNREMALTAGEKRIFESFLNSILPQDRTKRTF